MTSSAASTSYDEVPYPSFPLSQTHPDRLATLATLQGMNPPPVDRCRVLELGCADAGNILAMAEALPGSTFVGVDYSARHIAAGRKGIDVLGLANIRLEALSILDIPDDFGAFDYIISHGVYSWVPPPVQARLLALCKELLAPNGVAYISYNVYPGWHARGPVRDLMCFHTRKITDPKAATAAALEALAFLVEAVPPDQGSYRGLLQEELERLEKVRETYLFHEHLEEHNEPVYFHEFVARAAGHGLQFLAEGEFVSRLVQQLAPQSAAVLHKMGGNRLGREQYFDFLTNRMFRQTLLCHAEQPLREEPEPGRLAGLYVASRAECVSPPPDLFSSRVEEFRGPNGVGASTSHAITKAALVYLTEIWPLSVSFERLQAEARARLVDEAIVIQEPAEYARDTRLLAENLLQGFTADVVELHALPSCFVTSISDRPRASAVARHQAAEGIFVTSRRHESVRLDPLACQVVQHLDGSRDQAGLVDILVRELRENSIPLERHGRQVTDADWLRAILASEMEANLGRLAREGLLVA